MDTNEEKESIVLLNAVKAGSAAFMSAGTEALKSLKGIKTLGDLNSALLVVFSAGAEGCAAARDSLEEAKATASKTQSNITCSACREGKLYRPNGSNNWLCSSCGTTDPAAKHCLRCEEIIHERTRYCNMCKSFL